MNCCDNVHSWRSWPLPDGGGWQPAWPAGWTRAPNRRLAADLLITRPGDHVDVLVNFMPHRRGMALDADIAGTGPGIRAAWPGTSNSARASRTRRPANWPSRSWSPAPASPPGPDSATFGATQGRTGAPKPGRGGGPPGHRSRRRGPHPSFQDILDALQQDPALRDRLRTHILTGELIQLPAQFMLLRTGVGALKAGQERLEARVGQLAASQEKLEAGQQRLEGQAGNLQGAGTRRARRAESPPGPRAASASRTPAWPSPRPTRHTRHSTAP